eukprot:TRINITY_DN7808_c0_g1_i1.p1 TRINITY_DN7808_c0_g1~~TRINITY_DN7808_c0_g1_i1.p1  ORF type:complete len:430 (+),score=150.01 TRINITY_DN7808_c0_g1_i1:77-1291(+)
MGPVPWSLDAPRVNNLYSKASHVELRAKVRRFVEEEVQPNIDRWEEEGSIPREVHVKAARAGFYNVGIPTEYGGTIIPDMDVFHGCIIAEELSRPGALGFPASLLTWGIGLPPILRWGSEELKRRIAPGVASGEKLISLCISEPQTSGSDVANLATTAKREGDHYIVNGSKTLITTGMRADWFTVAVRTGGKGIGGVSLLVLEKGMPGFQQHDLKKMGWLCSDTAMLTFDNVRVPTANLIGKENQGFRYVMLNFNNERLSMATQSIAASRVAFEEAVTYARQRKTFGRPIIKNQGIRWKLMEVARQIEASQCMHDLCALRVQAEKDGMEPDPLLVARLSLLKVQCTRLMELACREACQIFGGRSFLRGGRAAKVERLYREVRVMAIGGGSEEIMLDLASRQARL